MGCRRLLRFLAKKEHKPTLRYCRQQRGALRDPTVNKVRIDVQGSIYATIKYAYTHYHSLEAAHNKVLKRIQKLRTPDFSLLHCDGKPYREKQAIHDERKRLRIKSLEAADCQVGLLEHRVQSNLRIWKQHFVNVNKELDKTFQWDPEARSSLFVYLRQHQYEAIESEMEVDISIARDCILGDTVISGDSNLVIHSTTTTIWRPL
jgi:hypothetical protein